MTRRMCNAPPNVVVVNIPSSQSTTQRITRNSMSLSRRLVCMRPASGSVNLPPSPHVIEVMNRTLLPGLLGALILVTASAESGAQPPARAPRELVARQTARPQPTRVDVVPPVDEQNARDTQQRLAEILRDYPPSVGQVLRLDP